MQPSTAQSLHWESSLQMDVWAPQLRVRGGHPGFFRRTCSSASVSVLAQFSRKPSWHPGTRCLDLELACHAASEGGHSSPIFTPPNWKCYKSLGSDKIQLQYQSKAGHVAHWGSASLAYKVVWVRSHHHTNKVLCVCVCMCVPALEKERQEEERFKVTLGCLVSLMIAWAA